MLEIKPRTMFEVEQSREAKEDAALSRLFDTVCGISNMSSQEYMELMFTFSEPRFDREPKGNKKE